MGQKIKLKSNLKVYGLKLQVYFAIPSEEIDELYYYVDDIPGDGRGLD
ncbi:hypothetical protein [Anoxybacter fermentans]|nr:hypothetical protein [Anoxybacter fermentans]